MNRRSFLQVFGLGAVSAGLKEPEQTHTTANGRMYPHRMLNKAAKNFKGGKLVVKHECSFMPDVVTGVSYVPN